MSPSWCDVCKCLIEHEKGFQDCFRPFLILTLNIIINQDDKQIKIIECLQKTKQNVPLWVSTIGSNFSLGCIGNIRYSKASRYADFGSRKKPCSSKPHFVRFIPTYTERNCNDEFYLLTHKTVFENENRNSSYLAMFIS